MLGFSVLTFRRRLVRALRFGLPSIGTSVPYNHRLPWVIACGSAKAWMFQMYTIDDERAANCESASSMQCLSNRIEG
jgi:hypothetical protein